MTKPPPSPFPATAKETTDLLYPVELEALLMDVLSEWFYNKDEDKIRKAIKAYGDETHRGLNTPRQPARKRQKRVR